MSLYLPPTLNEDQENLFSPLSNGRGNGRGSASARVWEESLDDVVSLTDESIKKLKQMQKPQSRLTSQTTKTLPLTVGTRARSASTSRATPSMPVHDRESEDPAATLQRKVEFLFRRTKMLDEKLRYAEKEKLESKTLTQETRIIVQHLTESFKVNQQQILAMGENVASLRGSIEALSRREKEMAVLIDSRTPHITSAELETVVEAVTNAVRGNLSSLTDEVRKNAASEQAKFLSRWSEKAASETERLRTETHRSEMEIIPAVKKEVQIMIGEFCRLKGRQDSIEGNYHTLQSAVNLREKKAEESHRQAIRTCKQDMASVIDTVGRRMNEYLSLNVKSVTVVELADIVVKQTGRLDSLYAHQSDLRAQLQSCSSLSHEASLIAREIQTKITGKPCNITDIVNSSFSEDDSNFPTESIESSIRQLRTDIKDFKCQCNENHISSITKMQSMAASHTKIKGKINDLSAGMGSVSKIRQAVESLLSEVNVKPPDSIQVSAQLNVRIKNIDSRLMALELITPNFEKQDCHNRENSLALSESKRQGDRCSTENGENKECMSLPPLLQQVLEKEISRLQSELEDTIKSCWADVVSRETKVAQEGAKLGEVVQRLQGVVVNMQLDQQSVAESVEVLQQRYQAMESIVKESSPALSRETVRILTPRKLANANSMTVVKPSLSDSVLFSSPANTCLLRNNRYPDPESPHSLLASLDEHEDFDPRGRPALFPSLIAASTSASLSMSQNLNGKGMEATRISSSGISTVEEGGMEEIDTREEDARMNVRMLASLTDTVYMNTGIDSLYRPIIPLDTSTSSVMNLFPLERSASTSSAGRENQKQTSIDRSEKSLYTNNSQRDTVTAADFHGDNDKCGWGHNDDSTSLLVPASCDKNDFDALRRSISLDDYIDPDEPQRLHLKKSQHRSQFLKMVMSKK